MKKLVRLLVVIGVLLLGVSGWLWWHNVRSTPDRVFWGMLDNSLRTRSVTRTVAQEAAGQSSNQMGRLQAAPTNLTVGNNKIVQQTEAGTTRVTTETIGTPFVDYVRYTEISAPPKEGQSKAPDFSKVKGVWGRSAEVNAKQTDGQLYSQAVLGVVPFANLPAKQRQQIMEKMRQAYSYDTGKVKREIKNHRPVYTFTVTLKPVAYVAMLKSLAGDIGLTQLENVNPEDYRSTPEATFQMTVDVWSRQLLSTAQPESPSQDNFGSYGLTSLDVSLPRDTTPISELQTRLQAIE